MDKTIVSLRAPFIVDGVFSLGAFLAAVVLLQDTGKAKSEHDLNVRRASLTPAHGRFDGGL